jgi:membrane associated rhomboid family serine protease
MSKALSTIIALNVGLFVCSMIPAVEDFARDYLWLRTDSPMLWQSVTYMFFHGSVGHLFWNMLSLFFFGPSVTRGFYGDSNFVRYYLICGLGAAVFSYIFGVFTPMGPILGASGAIFGLYYACYKFNPEGEVYIWGVFPVKLKYFLLGIGGFNLLMMLDQRESDVAYIAHLGGLATGILWFRYADSFIIMKKAWERKQQHRWAMEDGALRAEVDRILEKISQVGMGELSKKEKATLKEASRRFKK